MRSFSNQRPFKYGSVSFCRKVISILSTLSTSDTVTKKSKKELRFKILKNEGKKKTDDEKNRSLSHSYFEDPSRRLAHQM